MCMLLFSVAGGRSRLHCVMLGNGSPSISVLGGLLLAVLNGQRHLPSRYITLVNDFGFIEKCIAQKYGEV